MTCAETVDSSDRGLRLAYAKGWSYTQPRHVSSTAKTTTGLGSTNTSSFDFLGYRSNLDGRRIGWGRLFVRSLSATSTKAAQKIRKTIRGCGWPPPGAIKQLGDLARFINPIVHGWMNHYGRFYWSWCGLVLRHINGAHAAWVRRKFKRFRRKEQTSTSPAVAHLAPGAEPVCAPANGPSTDAEV
jgi:hypothetical protein